MEGISDPLSKPWGWSTRLYCNDTLQLERIFINAGGYSSIHLHENKMNMFIVAKGELIVNLFDDELNIKSTMTVTEGRTYMVGILVKHQFVASQEVEGHEVYWPVLPGMSLDPNDIIRFSDNGVDEAWAQRPRDDVFALCCGCNKQFAVTDLLTVCVSNALRDMCRSCINSTDTPPIGKQQ